jgi:tetraacyldisaccharide 4'-kinase
MCRLKSMRSRMVKMQEYFLELIRGQRAGAAGKLLLALLTVLSYPYALVLRLRAAAYASGLLRSYRLSCPVVSVGNITAGGTGKTPAVLFLARLLIDRGKRVAVISRGYGGSLEGAILVVSDGRNILLSPGEAGDEPYLLATALPGLMVVIGADRYRAGLFAIEQLAPDIILLDDGFQHLRLKRDLNILLLDCTSPFGNGRTLPAGLLREPLSAAGRADLVIYTRCHGRVPEQPVAGPFCLASHVLTGVTPLDGHGRMAFAELRQLLGMAFAGIADPESFFAGLRAEGLDLAATLPLPDHCRYDGGEIDTICRLKADSGADYLITTAKDGVKLGPYLQRLGIVHAAVLDMRLSDAGPLTRAVEKVLYKNGCV